MDLTSLPLIPERHPDLLLLTPEVCRQYGLEQEWLDAAYSGNVRYRINEQGKILLTLDVSHWPQKELDEAREKMALWKAEHPDSTLSYKEQDVVDPSLLARLFSSHRNDLIDGPPRPASRPITPPRFVASDKAKRRAKRRR
jgi:hypothetical protein